MLAAAADESALARFITALQRRGAVETAPQGMEVLKTPSPVTSVSRRGGKMIVDLPWGRNYSARKHDEKQTGTRNNNRFCCAHNAHSGI